MQRRGDRDWADSAACRGVDTELFFPVGDQGPALLQIDHAKAICARCPVIDGCLDVAVHSRQEHGIWGGQTAQERRAGERHHNRARKVGPDEDRMAS